MAEKAPAVALAHLTALGDATYVRLHTGDTGGLEKAPLSGGFSVRAVCGDGTEADVTPEIIVETRWSYLVPEGTVMVAGMSVEPGDTVSGKLWIA